MKLGLNTAILGDLNLREVFEVAVENDLDCLEVCCWPSGKAERKYAGVCHINVEDYDKEEILGLVKETGVSISALAYYPNVLDNDKETREVALAHLYKVMDAAKDLGVEIVGTFIGRDHTLNLEDNFKLVEEVWPPIVKKAEELDLKLAIENCPMLFTNDEWPGGKNLMTSPRNWHKIFEILDSDALGINYDPSHFIWQKIDYIKPIYEFKDKIFHVHFKDMKVYEERLDEVGTMGLPLEYMNPKLPGLGDVDWGRYCSAMYDIGFDGYACIEVEDGAFEGSLEARKKSVSISANYLRNFL